MPIPTLTAVPRIIVPTISDSAHAETVRRVPRPTQPGVAAYRYDAKKSTADNGIPALVKYGEPGCPATYEEEGTTRMLRLPVTSAWVGSLTHGTVVHDGDAVLFVDGVPQRMDHERFVALYDQEFTAAQAAAVEAFATDLAPAVESTPAEPAPTAPEVEIPPPSIEPTAPVEAPPTRKPRKA